MQSFAHIILTLSSFLHSSHLKSSCSFCNFSINHTFRNPGYFQAKKKKTLSSVFLILCVEKKLQSFLILVLLVRRKSCVWNYRNYKRSFIKKKNQRRVKNIPRKCMQYFDFSSQYMKIWDVRNLIPILSIFLLASLL